MPIASVTVVLAFLAAQAPARPAAPATPSNTAGLELQVRLDRAGFSPGEIDGKPGMVTRKAVAAFQRDRKLPETGMPDEKTLERCRKPHRAMCSCRTRSRQKMSWGPMSIGFRKT